MRQPNRKHQPIDAVVIRSMLRAGDRLTFAIVAFAALYFAFVVGVAFYTGAFTMAVR